MEAGKVMNSNELADQQAILQLLYSHSRGLDRLDATLIASAYWPDAEVDYGAYKGPAQDFAQLVVPALESQYELTQHSVSNSLIALEGDQAKVESYVIAGHLLHDAKEEVLFSGRYLDRVSKRDQQWKISHRQVVMEWSRRIPVTDERDSEAFGALAKGSHGEEDPLHTFLINA